MKKFIIAAAAFAAFTMVTAAPADAYAASGDYAKKSAKYAEFIANCTRPAESASLQDEAARKLEAMPADQFRLQVANCPKAPKATVVASRTRRHYESDNYAEVRAYLKSYDGPLWKTRGPIRNRYMNRQAPESAVPCRPPGYNRTVLCNPR